MAWMLFFALGVVTLWFIPKLIISGSALAPVFGGSIVLADVFLLFLLGTVGCLLLAVKCSTYLKCASAYLTQLLSGSQRVRRLIALLVVFMIGCLYAQWRAALQLTYQLPESLDKKDIVLEGRIQGLVRHQERINYDGTIGSKVSFYFKVDFIEPFKNEQSTHAQARALSAVSVRNLRLSSYDPEPVFLSDQRWRFTVRLRSPRGFANPGSFDSVRYMLSQHVDAQGYIRAAKRIDSIEPLPFSNLRQLREERHSLLQPIFAQLQYSGVHNALLLGDKSGLTQCIKSLLQQSGTVHLMAISGLHIGIAAGLGILLGRAVLYWFPMLMLHMPRPVFLAMCSFPLAFFYALLAGLSIPTQRALVMVASICLTTALRRNVHYVNHLLVALTALLVYDPLAVLSSGLWLSFAAVGLLLYSMAPQNQGARLPAASRSAVDEGAGVLVRRSLVKPSLLQGTQQKLQAALRAQLTIFIGMPVVLLAFGLPMPLVAPLANMLVVPLVSLFVVPLGLLALLVSYVSLDATAILLQLADRFLAAAMWLLQWLVGASPSKANLVSSLTLMQAVAACCAVIVLIGRWHTPFYRLAALVWLLLFNPFTDSVKPWQAELNQGDFVLTQLDVGQGSAVLISTRHHHWLYDTGGQFGQNSDAARVVVLPALRKLGVNKLDGVIVSHGDKDHAGGVLSLHRGLPIERWWLGGKAKAWQSLLASKQPSVQPLLQKQFASNQRVKASDCLSGSGWTIDGVAFEFLHPPASQALSVSENDQSCVLMIRSQRSVIEEGIGDGFGKGVAKNVAQGEGRGTSHGTALLTGDIGRRIEQQLLRLYDDDLSADILMVPHHGSKSSSSITFLAKVAPVYALVSSGFNNHYNHPHPDVVRRYLAQNIELLRSDQLGAIQLKFINQQWQRPRCARYLSRHFWQGWNNRGQCGGNMGGP
ncbi:DNA internalization-related competence protein ComEC/Rec2 [Pseudomonadales bacterium]|nr:DNA internalization-related competence protein ComEC/Rec2 [Pseudomonadales bacterium]